VIVFTRHVLVLDTLLAVILKKTDAVLRFVIWENKCRQTLDKVTYFDIRASLINGAWDALGSFVICCLVFGFWMN